MTSLSSAEKSTLLEKIQQVKRIVIKIGTNSLLTKEGSYNFVSISQIVKSIQRLKAQGKDVVLVSSGAVSAGKKQLKMKNRPNDIVMQQVLAAIGNPLLIQQYITMFEDTPVAQVLLSQHDLSDRQSYQHFRNAMDKMFEMGVIPIVNENDVVSIDELLGTVSNPSTTTQYNFNDNDVLSALITGAVDANLLLILSDIDGLYSKHPSSNAAQFIDVVEKMDENIFRMAQKGDKEGRGGMRTKLKAAEIATKSGAYTIITNARDFSDDSLFSNQINCTIFLPDSSISKRSHWLLYSTTASGNITVDQGAVKALQKGASLLLPGIVAVDGQFREKDIIKLTDHEGNAFAKGITNYSSRVLEERLSQQKEGILPNKTFVIISNENLETLL